MKTTTSLFIDLGTLKKQAFTNTKINPPGGSVENWQSRVDQAKKDKHPISLCILMYEDGTLGEATEALLKQLKR